MIIRKRFQKKKTHLHLIFTRQGFIPPNNAVAITLLEKHYKIYLLSDPAEVNRSTPVIDGHGLVNGAYMQYGK